eukprot:contig_8464_g1987
MDRPVIGRKALKRRLVDDSAEAASLAAHDKSMRVVSQSLSRCNKLGEEAQKPEKQRMELDNFNRPENRHTPEGFAFQAHMLATMAAFGAEPAVAPSEYVAGGDAGANAGEPAGVGDCEDEDEYGDTVVAWAPEPIAASSTLANKARGAKSMATMAALEDAALRATATIDLTFPLTVGGHTSGSGAGVADDDWASGSLADRGDGKDNL